MLTLGGVAYLVFGAMPARAGESVVGGCWRGIRWAAASFAIVELCYVAVDSAILMGSSSLRSADLVGAPYFLAGASAAIAAFAIVVCARVGGRRSAYALLPLGVLILLAVVSTSHSVSRLDHRGVLTALTAAHQLGAAIWIGAMPFLLISLRRSEDPEEAKRLLRRFSPMALAGAGTVLLGGLGMAWLYLGISDGKSLNSSVWDSLWSDDDLQAVPVAAGDGDGRGEFFSGSAHRYCAGCSVDAAAAIWRGGDWAWASWRCWRRLR